VGRAADALKADAARVASSTQSRYEARLDWLQRLESLATTADVAGRVGAFFDSATALAAALMQVAARVAFLAAADDAASAFAPSISSGPSPKWLADLQRLAILRIEQWGRDTACLPKIHLAQDRRCVFQNADQFFSFRREKVCGRMASAIGLRLAS
jgi:hypothetical protein